MNKLRWSLAAIVLAAGCSSLTPSEDPVALRMTDIEARLIRLERVVENQSLVELVSELERLRSESAALRGEIETLRFETENSDSRQRELYVDLDRRINGLESAPRSFEPLPAVGPPGPRADPTEVAPAVASRPAGSDQQNYEAALDLIESRRYDEANRAFTAFLSSFPTSPLADNAQYWQRSGQPVSRTNTVGQPVKQASPWIEKKISLTLSRAAAISGAADAVMTGVAPSSNGRGAARRAAPPSCPGTGA